MISRAMIMPKAVASMAVVFVRRGIVIGGVCAGVI